MAERKCDKAATTSKQSGQGANKKTTPGRPPSSTRTSNTVTSRTRTPVTEGIKLRPSSSNRKVNTAPPNKTRSYGPPSKSSYKCEKRMVSPSQTTSDTCESEVADSANSNHRSDFVRQRSGCAKKESKNEDCMPAHMVEYCGKKYDLSKSTSVDRELVQNQSKYIEEELKLKMLGNDLSSLGKFVRLACCGVVGHTDLEIKTREVLVSIGDITDDTYHTLDDFERTSKRAIETMQTAYAFLKENLEVEALNMFKKIQKNAEEMCEISNSLSDKCKEQSKKVTDLSNETIKEKAATEKEKKKTDELINESRIGQQHQKEIMENSISQADKKEKIIVATLDDEKKVFEKKTELAKQCEQKKQVEQQEIKQRKAELKSKYDDDDNKVTIAIKESHKKFEQTLLTNKDSYNIALKKLDTTLKEQIKSAENAYETELKHIEEEFKEAKEQNDILCEQKVNEYKQKYEKALSDAEAEYKFTTSQIEQDYRNTIQSSDDELQRKLTLALQTKEAALNANERNYSAKVNACFLSSSKAKVQEEWSEKDAECEKAKSDTESTARSENISAQRNAQKDREDKLSNAFKDRQNKIEQAEKLMNQNISKVKQDTTNLKNKAIEAKRKQTETAESTKKKAISIAQKTKEDGELQAKNDKEDSEESAKLTKETEDKNNKSHKESLFQKYQFDLKQLDDELTHEEKEIDDEYQKQLKIFDDEFQELKEQCAKQDADVKSLQKQREESFQQMLQFAQKLKDGIKSSEGQQTSIDCLHEAIKALKHIEVIMRNAYNFWKKIGKHCKGMSENLLSTQIQSIENQDTLTRKRMYESDVFKQAAVQYSGQWHALKETCGAASEHISLVQDEINQYLCEHLTENEAVELVKQLATDLLGSDIANKMITDKSANN